MTTIQTLSGDQLDLVGGALSVIAPRPIWPPCLPPVRPWPPIIRPIIPGPDPIIPIMPIIIK